MAKGLVELEADELTTALLTEEELGATQVEVELGGGVQVEEEEEGGGDQVDVEVEVGSGDQVEVDVGVQAGVVDVCCCCVEVVVGSDCNVSGGQLRKSDKNTHTSILPPPGEVEGSSVGRVEQVEKLQVSLRKAGVCTVHSPQARDQVLPSHKWGTRLRVSGRARGEVHRCVPVTWTPDTVTPLDWIVRVLKHSGPGSGCSATLLE